MITVLLFGAERINPNYVDVAISVVGATTACDSFFSSMLVVSALKLTEPVNRSKVACASRSSSVTASSSHAGPKPTLCGSCAMRLAKVRLSVLAHAIICCWDCSIPPGSYTTAAAADSQPPATAPTVLLREPSSPRPKVASVRRKAAVACACPRAVRSRLAHCACAGARCRWLI